MIYLLIVYGLLRYFNQTLHDGGLPDPTGPLLPIFHHRPSYKSTTKLKLSLTENLHIVYASTQESLNVAIHMPCVIMHCAGRYQFKTAFTFLCLPLIAMSNVLHVSVLHLPVSVAK